MLSLDKLQSCYVDRLTVTECTRNADEDFVCRTRIKFEVPLGLDELEALPISVEGVKAFIEESQGIEEGERNSTKIAVKRDIPIQAYSLLRCFDEGHKASLVCSFVGETKNQPSVIIVQGEAFGCWEVEALIDPDTVRHVASMVEEDGVFMTAKSTQLAIPFEQVA